MSDCKHHSIIYLRSDYDNDPFGCQFCRTRFTNSEVSKTIYDLQSKLKASEDEKAEFKRGFENIRINLYGHLKEKSE